MVRRSTHRIAPDQTVHTTRNQFRRVTSEKSNDVEHVTLFFRDRPEHGYCALAESRTDWLTPATLLVTNRALEALRQLLDSSAPTPAEQVFADARLSRRCQKLAAAED